MSDPAPALTDAALTGASPPPRARAAARAAWVDRLRRFAQSGLRPAPFCAQEGVSLPSFYAWKRRLAAAVGPAPALDAGAQREPRWLPVRLPDPAAPLELALPSGAVLRIAAGADEATLRGLLRLLGVPTC
jgi:transposase